MKAHLSAAIALVLAVPFAQAANANEANVRAAVQKLVPTAKVDKIEPSPIEGYSQAIIGSQNARSWT